METLVIIIVCMVGFNFMLKLTWHGIAGKIALCIIGALFILLVTDAATMQSKT